ncbi:MAG: DDE-type integrase/transposase/recombinase, partial [Aigarchaeota archaeon]|nr:DDE-type integrase/transposase/recombinase [Candidatus Geocrenenecus dongiae]
IAIDETELKVEKTIVYVWSTVDVDSKKLLTLEALYCRSCLNTLKFIKKVLKLCLNKPKIIVDRGPWYK